MQTGAANLSFKACIVHLGNNERVFDAAKKTQEQLRAAGVKPDDMHTFRSPDSGHTLYTMSGGDYFTFLDENRETPDEPRENVVSRINQNIRYGIDGVLKQLNDGITQIKDVRGKPTPTPAEGEAFVATPLLNQDLSPVYQPDTDDSYHKSPTKQIEYKPPKNSSI